MHDDVSYHTTTAVPRRASPTGGAEHDDNHSKLNGFYTQSIWVSFLSI